jgi:5-methylcytosine-specific restriction endonuclease McrA
MSVFVLDKKKRPLMPCSEKRARLLLQRGRAVVVRMHPFTIRLKDWVGGAVQPVRIQLDPGSKTTGIALVRADGERQHVLWLAELEHRGQAIRKALTQRSGYRRRRRSVNLRFRAPRFDNRTRAPGWLAPSVRHRVETATTWTDRLCRLAPVSGLAMELVRFDMQQMQNPQIQGVEYQQGALAGYEVREYLLEKWGRRCAYCGAEGVPLQVEHIHPRAAGGSDRVSNLSLACGPCNHKKGAQPVEVFLARRPEVLRRVLAQAKTPLRDAAAVNSTRWALHAALQSYGLPVETASGGRTKWNRARLGIPKTHALDAACVGVVQAVLGWERPALAIKATGRGSYQRTRVTEHGFARGYLTRIKRICGFQTGDRVCAEVPTGKKVGIHVGRVAVRASGSFNIQTPQGVVQGVSHRHCRLVQRADGYAYTSGGASALRSPAIPPRPERRGFSRRSG